jgi:hypothetical protein
MKQSRFSGLTWVTGVIGVALVTVWTVVSMGLAQAAPPRGLDIDEHFGVIGRIDSSSRTILIDGNSLQWDAQRLQVRHAATGQPVALEKLRSGMWIGYALEPQGTSTPPRIVTIYVRDLP